MEDLYYEISFGAHKAFRAVIPEPQDRIPVSWNIVPVLALSPAPFIFLAYLSRRPDTHLIRMLLLPIVILTSLAPAYGYRWMVPELNVYNWGQSLFAIVYIGKALQFAFVKQGMLKVGEIRPGEMKLKMKEKQGMNGEAVAGTTPESNAAQPGHPWIASWLYDAVEVSCAMRGYGWKFGRGVHLPKDPRPMERTLFLRATFLAFLKNFLLLDLYDSALKFFPGVGSPLGGSMFYPNLPPLQRYLVSTTIHMISGSALMAGFSMVYDLVTIICVGLLDNSPSSWPPIIDNPWHSDSMHVFWSKRWHQLLRQTFLVYGGYPGRWLAGDAGMVLGAFIASAMYHELSIYTMGRGFDFTVPMVFLLQPVLLILERLWRIVTGRRVGGWIGRLWVYFLVFIAAQPLVDSWHKRGLGGGMLIPPFISPTRLILVPLIQFILHRIQG